MDPSVPVAKRTRSKEADYFKKLHDKIRRKSNGSDDLVSDGITDGKRRNRRGVDKIRGNVKVDSKFDSDLDIDCCPRGDVKELDEDVVACSEKMDDGFEFLGFDGWGPKSPTKLKIDSKDCENVVPIEIVSSEDEGSCSKLREEETEKSGCVEEDEFARNSSGSLEERENVNNTEIIDSDEIESVSSDAFDQSSEEDNDDPEDADFMEEDQSLVQLLSSDSEETSESEEEETMTEIKEKEVVVEFKKREAYGVDVLVNSSKEKNERDGVFINKTQGSNFVAKHTRSKFSSMTKEKTINLKTLSQPLFVNEEEDDKNHDSSGRDEGNLKSQAKDCEKSNIRTFNVDQFMQEEVGKYGEEVGKSTKRKRVRAPKELDLMKILLDSLSSKNNENVEDLVSSKEEILDQESSSSLITTWKFLYPLKEPNPPEEEQEDENEDKSLWIEFDFALRSSEIDSTDSCMMNNTEDYNTSDMESDPATLCGQGKHQFVINDEVGLICKFCSFVSLEMKYISPSFNTRTWRRLQSKDYDKTNYNKSNMFQFLDSAYDSQLDFDPFTNTEGTVWEIVPGIRNTMYRHQREAFEFIWKITEGGISLNELKSNNFNSGSGCVISHAPGTGKTRLILAFLQAYMELYPKRKPVIIAPLSMLLTWEEQCKIWNFPMPFHILNNNELSGKENVSVLNLLKEAKNEDKSIDINRIIKIYSWAKGKSILGLSYRLFERLIWKGEMADDEKKCKIKNRAYSEIRKFLLEVPDILVLDEGHTPRNDQSMIWKALSKIQTEKRIILSGTPFQNNFDELYNTLCLVRPKFAETILVQSRRGNNFLTKKRGIKIKEARGNWVSLTNSIGSYSSNKLEKLRAMIDPFVHVHMGTILQERLPGLRDTAVILHPTDLQKLLLEKVQGLSNPFELGLKVSLISAHPSLSLFCGLTIQNSIVDKDTLKKLRLNPNAGVKTKFLVELIKLSEAMNEKVLIFSQYIHPLTLIMDQLKSHFNWVEGKELLYMDGKRDVKERQSSINAFNEEAGDARVLLASIRACCEGINLIGASRVVLLDVVWNPSVEQQAISRAYRLGQKKIVHVYHLITSGTVEGEKYCRQAEKDRLSGLVFSSNNMDNNNVGKVTSGVSDDKVLEEMVHHDKLKNMFEKIVYQPKESDLIESFGVSSQAYF